jgi:hypothetical protein
MRRFSEADMRRLELDDVRNNAYAPIAHMSRAERRTARGRQLVAEAEARALRAEIEILRRRIAEDHEPS